MLLVPAGLALLIGVVALCAAQEFLIWQCPTDQQSSTQQLWVSRQPGQVVQGSCAVASATPRALADFCCFRVCLHAVLPVPAGLALLTGVACFVYWLKRRRRSGSAHQISKASRSSFDSATGPGQLSKVHSSGFVGPGYEHDLAEAGEVNVDQLRVFDR